MSKHTHSYKRINISQKGEYYVYKCQVTNCPHYLTPELVVGKLSVCPRCGDEFEITKEDLEKAYPYCSHCRRNKETNV